MDSATLNPREERRLMRGHLWAYRNEFKQLPNAEDGALLDVFTSNRRFAGRGFYQAEGGIAVRILARHQVEIDAGFLRDRITQARAYREQMYPGASVYRWVHGESDFLPGLVADRYGEIVVLQSACAFHARNAELLARLFRETPGVKAVRAVMNGAAQDFGEIPETVVCDLDGLEAAFNPRDAQKTGLFLDQRDNMAMLDRIAPGARVLDGHCYAGLWSVRAAKAGAREVLGADTAAPALERARDNAGRNGCAAACRFVQAPIEEILEKDGPFDVVLIDPPAFAKSRAHLRKALSRYQALNAAAMRAVSPGGYLVTSSCSHFVDAPAFLESLKRAAAAARREVGVIEMRGAAKDHPQLLAMPETAYLKCAALRVW